jgi:hypothetical protein
MQALPGMLLSAWDNCTHAKWRVYCRKIFEPLMCVYIGADGVLSITKIYGNV